MSICRQNLCSLLGKAMIYCYRNVIPAPRKHAWTPSPANGRHISAAFALCPRRYHRCSHSVEANRVFPPLLMNDVEAPRLLTLWITCVNECVCFSLRSVCAVFSRYIFPSPPQKRSRKTRSSEVFLLKLYELKVVCWSPPTAFNLSVHTSPPDLRANAHRLDVNRWLLLFLVFHSKTWRF